ncbi:MAG: biotin--[acetyl-CoA-carboxylase] ligase [Clostridia bacterium]|nr:biotin--[acetyl-CoA-carboxylase] ligase [Clostridia bacterium]
MRSILEILAQGGQVSGEEISRELGISRAAVWKKIEALREAGWQIESAGKLGYRLEPGDRLEPVLWESKLETSRLGRGEIAYHDTVDSTNTQLKIMAAKGAPDGSVCLCECQNGGKGRLGRSWNSPAGQGIWVSLLLRPQLRPEHAPLLTLCTAMAMNRAIRETTGADSRIKWPNDIICGGKKLCGILLEISADMDHIDYVVIGTGLNVYPGAYPEELKHQATSLQEVGKVQSRAEILIHYLRALEEYAALLEQKGFAGIADAYRAQSCTLGSRVNVIGSINMTGTAEDIDETGALLVRDDSGELHRVLAGDVSVRGVMGYV